MSLIKDLNGSEDKTLLVPFEFVTYAIVLLCSSLTISPSWTKSNFCLKCLPVIWWLRNFFSELLYCFHSSQLMDVGLISTIFWMIKSSISHNGIISLVSSWDCWYVTANLSVYLSIDLSIYLFICLSIYLSIDLSIDEYIIV